MNRQQGSTAPWLILAALAALTIGPILFITITGVTLTIIGNSVTRP